MQNLYQEVLDANISFDAARTGLDSARITWENAQKKYSMGMLSRTDYLQEQKQLHSKGICFPDGGIKSVSGNGKLLLGRKRRDDAVMTAGRII